MYFKITYNISKQNMKEFLNKILFKEWRII